MKKRIALLVTALVIIIGIIVSFGFTGTQQQNYVIDSKAFNKLPKPMQDGEMLERANTKLGFSTSLGSDSTRLHLNLHTKQPNPSELMFQATGNGFLKFGDNKFNFKINEERSYLQQLNNDGQTVLVGLIIGEIKSKKDSIEELTINAAYYPDTKKGQFGVVIGTIGDEILIPYGDPIVDEKLANLIDKEINKKNLKGE
jgi:hypothetical protein